MLRCTITQRGLFDLIVMHLAGRNPCEAKAGVALQEIHPIQNPSGSGKKRAFAGGGKKLVNWQIV